MTSETGSDLPRKGMQIAINQLHERVTKLESAERVCNADDTGFETPNVLQDLASQVASLSKLNEELIERNVELDRQLAEVITENAKLTEELELIHRS